MNEGNFTTLMGLLARGDKDEARRYAMCFPRADRVPSVLRARLADRATATIMREFERIAPWLLDEADDITARITTALRAAGTAGLTRAGIRSKVSGTAADELREAVDRMVDRMEVQIERKATHGRPADVFRLTEFAADITPADLNRNPFARRHGRFIPDSEMGRT